MKILGCALDGEVLRGVVVERAPRQIAVEAFFERGVVGGDLAAALSALVIEAGVKETAWTLPPADAAITRLASADTVFGRERQRAAQFRAEALGFGATDVLRVVEGSNQQVYVAVAKREAISSLEGICRQAGASLAFVDSEAYAWSAVVPSGAQALLLVDADVTRLIVVGAEQAQMGVYPWRNEERALEAREVAAVIAADFVNASVAGFADVNVVAVMDPGARLEWALSSEMRHARTVPFTLALDPEHTAWALACGAALRAAQYGQRRLRVNFAQRGSDLARQIQALALQIRVDDAAVAGIGMALALGLVAWRAETLRELSVRSSMLQASLMAVGQHVRAFTDDTAAMERARQVVITVDETRRSGPLWAREVATIASRLKPGTSASSLSADQNGWSIAGHARTYADVADVVGELAGAGFSPTVSGTSLSNGRLGYNLTLERSARP